ncbi:MAG: sulfatase-like hydrolase/transferase [Opitutales bacterium]
MSSPKTRPNVLFLISDDTALEYIGFSGGGPRALTPNLDRIAREGMVFEQAYVSSAVCTPSRYSWFTGRHAGRCDSEPFLSENPTETPYCIKWNVHAHDPRMTAGALLQSAGYATGYVGKMHCGLPAGQIGAKRLPEKANADDPTLNQLLKENQQAFIRELQRIGHDFAGGVHWGNLDDGASCPSIQVHNIEWATANALEFLQQQENSDKPFFLTFATSVIHGPGHVEEGIEADPRITRGGYLDAPPQVQAPRETIRPRLEAAGLDYNHRTAGALWLDDAVGALLAQLETMGELDNTVIIYSSDHNVDGKGTCYERGSRVPLCVRWPGKVTAGTRTAALVQNVDLIPTLMEITGAHAPEAMPLDGQSWLPLLTQRTDTTHEDLYLDNGWTRGLRHGRYKYFAFRYPEAALAELQSGKTDEAMDYFGSTGQQREIRNYPNFWDPDQLYDVKADPEERNNLAGDPQYAKVLADMRARLRKHLDTFAHPFDLSDQPFMHTERYREMAAKTASIGPEIYDWYRRGIY